MELKLTSGKSAVKKRFEAAPGKDFPIDPAPAIEANTKGFLVRAVVVSAILTLAITGFYALAYQKYGPLVAAWSVIGPILGAMINHYFGGHRKDSG